MTTAALGPFDLERVFRAVNKVTERACRTGAALDAAGIPYAIIGGNAVANWVSRVDESAVRFTKDVDILIRRDDLETAASALSAVGFVRRHAAGIDFFLDGANAKFRDAVQPPACIAGLRRATYVGRGNPLTSSGTTFVHLTS